MSESGAITKPGAIEQRLSGAITEDRTGQSFGSVGITLKKALAESRRTLLETVARGDVIATRLSHIMDEAIATIARAAVADAPANARIAIAATGGYGRSQIAPLSDVDLLILHAGVGEEELKSIVNAILYPLWDAGLTVGQGVHTPATAIRLAAGDMTAMTAFLDARFIFGDEKVFKDFSSKFDLLRWRMKSRFVKAKREEQELRHDSSNQSRYLSEPDLKEGKGGLRDIHVIGWIYRALYGRPLSAAPKRGAIFRPEDAESLRKAERFLLSLRVHLHELRGRADERLTFDIQPALAERLGYADRADMSAAERMMKHYFLNAMEIGRLTRIFWARLEEENAKLLDRAPTPLPKTLSADELGKKVNLRIKNGRLDFASAAAAKRDPIDLFRYFRAFAKRPDIDFHPDALDLISKCAISITSDVRRNPDIARLFVATITTAKDPVKLLRVMSETGLLGKYVPSLGRITGRVEYGLFRRYSMEEHVFQAVGILAKIKSGALVDEHPIATSILKEEADVSPYFVMTLLHQSGWALKDQDLENAQALIARIAKRLGAGEATGDLAWCAARPLSMVGVANRRNLGEARAIADFASSVESTARLRMLLVLTVCHLRAVSDSAWDEWTRKQISTLYFGALAWLEGGEDALSKWMRDLADETRREAETALADWPKVERTAFLKRLSNATLAMIDPQTFTRAAALARSAEACGVAASIRDAGVEAIVYADDRRGLLADLAGAVAGVGGDVRNVHALTLEDGKVIDVFLVRAPEGQEGEALAGFVRSLHSALLDAARVKPAEAPILSRRIGDRRAIFSVPSVVRMDAHASDEALVVEAEGKDRPGLLYALTAGLAELGVQIRSAHIATYGERVVDAFYLQTEDGAKITDKRMLAAIEKRLLGGLGDGARGALRNAV
ncbi:MAG: [protein-PII] uridylyltransferase [Parvularculaceae bacterium]|nr:[protein-PII] uridylyltransferase [Parvularculaceae bacterium]